MNQPTVERDPAPRPVMRQLANVLCALLQFVTPYFSRLTGIGRSIEQVATTNNLPAPETPAGYAFSIWFVIFSLALVYSFYQALPSQSNHPVFKKIGTLTALLFLFNSVWMLLAQSFGDGWHLVAVIFSLLCFALSAFFKMMACKEPLTIQQNHFNYRVLHPLLGLSAGWLTVAAFLNLFSVAKISLIQLLHCSINAYAILTLASAMGLSLWVLWRTQGHGWYAAAITWALVGVAVTNLNPLNPVMLSVVLGLFILVGLIMLLSRRADISQAV